MRKSAWTEVHDPNPPCTRPNSLADDVSVIHRHFGRSVLLHPGNVAVKSGHGVTLEEAAVMCVAHEAGLPVPRVHSAETIDGTTHIRMDYIPGTPLQELWPYLTPQDKQHITAQVHDFLAKMRAIPFPEGGVIGDCLGHEIRDRRTYFTYNSPVCADEPAFNEYLVSSIHKNTPLPLRDALADRVRSSTGHRIVLSHCDLQPRNIIANEQGDLAAVIDWEDAGWYPEYWEYIKFFYRPTYVSRDWRDGADVMFPRSYNDELLNYAVLAPFQD